jgi:hypothetical protein
VIASIKNRFPALVRCLDLIGSPGPFKLLDGVVPVVPISSCLERLAFAINVQAAAGVAVVLSESQVAGVYRVSWQWSNINAAAGGQTSRVDVFVGGVLTTAIAVVLSSAIGSQVLSGNAEVNVPENSIFRLTADATGAGNVTCVHAVIQPL